MLRDEIDVRYFEEGLELSENENTGVLPALIVNNEIMISSRLETESQKNECKIHEFGHFKTTPKINLFNEPKEVQDRFEYRADRAGIIEFISLNNLLAAYKAGCRNCFEYCEELQITEQYFLRVLEIHANIYGLMTLYDGYTFTFNPLSIRKHRKRESE